MAPLGHYDHTTPLSHIILILCQSRSPCLILLIPSTRLGSDKYQFSQPWFDSVTNQTHLGILCCGVVQPGTLMAHLNAGNSQKNCIVVISGKCHRPGALAVGVYLADENFVTATELTLIILNGNHVNNQRFLLKVQPLCDHLCLLCDQPFFCSRKIVASCSVTGGIMQ